MYTAFVQRDASYDGLFVVAVRTTGIFCRPVCPARKPRRENVEFFATAAEALRAGYRPCRRCRPLDHVSAPPPWLERLLHAVDAQPAARRTDADLRAIRIDPARVRRYFRRHYGMTFHAYQRARRMGLALAEMHRGAGASAAGLRTGFSSESAFRDAFARTFGATPGRSAAVRCLLARWIDTPLGTMLAVADDAGLHLLEFVDRPGLEAQMQAMLRRAGGSAAVPGEHAHLRSIADELDRYFAGTLRRFKTPVVLEGTAFQVQVWRRLCEIAYGGTCSYAALAEAVGRPGASRAVGRANGQNRLAIIVPCHRVVRSDGTLCGYGGGVWRKRRLLAHEGSGGIEAVAPAVERDGNAAQRTRR